MNWIYLLTLIPILLTRASFYSDAASTAKERRQLATDFSDQESYLEPAPRILPAPYINPAPEILPSQAIDNTGDVEPAGAIQPAPQIEPAPAILPSNAINEKDRASPMSKRHGIQGTNAPRQAVHEVLVIEHQMAGSRIHRFPPQPKRKNATNNNKPLPIFAHIKHTPHKALPLHEGQNSKTTKTSFDTDLLGRIKVKHKPNGGDKHNSTKSSHFRQLLLDSKHTDGNTLSTSNMEESRDRDKVSFKFKFQLKNFKLSKHSFRPKTYDKKQKLKNTVKKIINKEKKRETKQAAKREVRSSNRWPKALRIHIQRITSKRDKRQVMLPLNIGNQATMDPLQQQIVPGFPLPQDLPDQQQVLGGMVTGQTGNSLLPDESLLRRQNILTPFLGQGDQQLPLQQSPVIQPALPIQQPLFLAPVQQPMEQFNTIPAISTIPYQNPPLAPQYVQTETQTTTGRSRHTIPEAYHEYTLDEDYAYPRHHRPRHHHQHYRPYDAYRSFEYTYGKSPGIFDDLKDISNEMNIFDDNYAPDHHMQREWVEDSYDAHARRYHHQRRHHRKPLRSEYDEYEPGDEASPQIPAGYTDSPVSGISPAPGIGVNSEENHEREPNEADARELETLHDEESEKTVKPPEANSKEVKTPTVARLEADIDEESEGALAKRKGTIKQLDKDAIMHLDFDETSDKRDLVKDASGNGNDASLMDGAAITVKTLGTCGRGAILKKGEISYKGAFFKRKPTKAVTIAMWVKSKNPGFIRWFDEDNTPDKGFFASTKSASVGKNRWTHLAGTFDTKTGIARIYVNGKLKVEKAGKKDSGLPQDFTSTGIGRKFGDTHVSFLDDVYMFDRVLSSDEVHALYRKCQFNRMILHFGFQHWNGTTEVLSDQSGLQNNATLKGGAKVRPKADCDKCGACLDLQSDSNSQVYLNSTKYRQKPRSAVSISTWINLNRTKGLHSIFQAVNDKTGNNLYNLEVIDGKVHWQSKDKNGEIIFDALTNEVTIPEGLWCHVTGTYSARTGNAKIYVNGLLRASFQNPEEPELSTAWTKASIGGHFPDDKPFNGMLDEFFMYNWELDSSEVRFVSKYCADKPKLVSFTVKVPIL